MIDSNIAVLFVVLLRLFIPFTILRWPLAGGILAMIADGIDVMIFEAFGYGFLSGIKYHYIDKTFDMWYLSFEFFVLLRWKDRLAINTGKILYFLRLAGYILFMFIGIRAIFVFTPNIFEYFFLAMLVIWKVKPRFKLKKKSLIIILLIVGIPNMIKEYVYHYAYENRVWVWVRDHWFWWLYN